MVVSRSSTCSFWSVSIHIATTTTIGARSNKSTNQVLLLSFDIIQCPNCYRLVLVYSCMHTIRCEWRMRIHSFHYVTCCCSCYPVYITLSLSLSLCVTVCTLHLAASVPQFFFFFFQLGMWLLFIALKLGNKIHLFIDNTRRRRRYGTHTHGQYLYILAQHITTGTTRLRTVNGGRRREWASGGARADGARIIYDDGSLPVHQAHICHRIGIPRVLNCLFFSFSFSFFSSFSSILNNNIEIRSSIIHLPSTVRNVYWARAHFPYPTLLPIPT